MSKKIIFLLLAIIALGIITFYSNEYFEDKIYGQNKKVLGSSIEDRFFLPFPKDYQVISSSKEQRKTDFIINVPKPAIEIKDFYKEILRSKSYENDYEYEKDNVIELKYTKDSEEIKIVITEENQNSIVEFNYYK